ncbi:type III secretion system inner rod subunit SctI [Glaciimonas sp. PCH181]|uniref:type III secretion system inner rod subunit SctI n=1 Tax=Glaciimonas sp. PCH181 TaxID=2133943 RepID=UPI000D3C5FDC|nr:type III secretion system inner rod subunit SctI [Glaciimonas sp. PCH181]PUA19958.1 type III secretion system protein PrgJ [Glaciimonas sp. PCH181]
MHQTTAINALSGANALAFDDISVDGGSPISLESRAMQAYAQSVMSAEHNKSDIMLRLEAPGLTSPEELQAIQEKVADYGIRLSMVSTLSRKVTSAVETLLRS